MMAVRPTREPGDPIAIVGIGCLFPGCESPAQLWECISSGSSTTTDVPDGRWIVDSAQVFDPGIARPDHVYSTKGGFVTLPPLETTGLDIDDEFWDGLDPLFHLVLHVASRAWRDARTETVDRARAGVIFGNIVLPTETASALSREHFRRLFEEGLGIPPSSAGQMNPLNAFPAGMPATLVARALGLGGAAYTLDAACGSSLYALKLAVDELQSGRAEAMICGGASRPDPLHTQMGFSQLRALSARGKPAPFDADADGLVVGEGAGMFVLKRLEVALEHGDHIYGVIAGIGLSNDRHGDLLAPSAEGQVRAMRQAYEQAGWSPSDVDLIECHATGTPRGDAVELESLSELWRNDRGQKKNGAIIGSVKSNIGHTLTAAGAAGLLKVLLALHHRVLPPSANFQKPNPALELHESPFRIIASSEPWPSRASGGPRRAAVSGFGFGGINAHVLIEEWTGAHPFEKTPAEGGNPRTTGHRSAGAFELPARSMSTNDRNRPRGSAVAARTSRAPIAIVGMAARFGEIGDETALANHILADKPSVQPLPPPNWWGMPNTRWFHQAGWNDRSFLGYYLDSLEFRVDRFRIPPKELVEILPQQSLMLDVAARALREANWQSALAARTGVLVGIGLDLNTTNYDWRWSIPELARGWSGSLGLTLSDDERTRWIDALRQLTEPPLSANRTIGSLGGVVASRIAREFQIGGPSFSISCDENSGIQALAVAVDWLRRMELDAAVVGAVDLAGDVRGVLARSQLFSGGPARNAVACDGAVCLVLKRLDDAVRDGDRIAAMIGEVTTHTQQLAVDRPQDMSPSNDSARWDQASDDSSGSPIGYLDVYAASQFASARWPCTIPGRRSAVGPPAAERANVSAGSDPPPADRGGSPSPSHETPAGGAAEMLTNPALVSPTAPRGSCAVGSVLSDLGHLGAATGLAAVIKAAVCLEQQIIPAPRGPSQWLRSLAEAMPSLFVPGGPQFWLRNRADGPRRAAVCVSSLGGGTGEVLLEEFEPPRVSRELSGPRLEAVRPRTAGLFMLEADDEEGYRARIEELGRFANQASCKDIDALARRWWQHSGADRRSTNATAFVADGIPTLVHLLEHAAARPTDCRIEGDGARGSIHATHGAPISASHAPVAFVYPGLGSHFVGMGRELSATWPDVLRRLDGENRRLRDQFDPAVWWGQAMPGAFDDPRVPIWGIAWIGCLLTAILRRLGIEPRAAIGYSMGESTALLSLQAWIDREELFARIRSSTLFERDLTGPCEAARRLWKLPANEPADWVAGVVDCSNEAVSALISPGGRVYVLARNLADETVVGGQRREVARVLEQLRCSFAELPCVSTVHCEVGRTVEAEYHALHDLQTSAPADIDFYSGVWGQSYPVDRQTAAEAITSHATQPIDFPAVIERAYQNGVRVFLEVGPGSSCTRLVDRILGARPHLALAACQAGTASYHTFLEMLGTLRAHGIPVELGRLYGSTTRLADDVASVTRAAAEPGRRTVRVAVRGHAFAIPLPRSSAHAATLSPSPARPFGERSRQDVGAEGIREGARRTGGRTLAATLSPSPPRPFGERSRQDVGGEGTRKGARKAGEGATTYPSPSPPRGEGARWAGEGAPVEPSQEDWSWSQHLYKAESATAEAHRAFLRTSEQTAELMGRLIAFQFELLKSGGARAMERASTGLAQPATSVTNEALPSVEDAVYEQRQRCEFAFGRDQCLEFAVGSIAAVLGLEYAPIDHFPTRVRLPDEPLMLVDRILTIQGQPRSLQDGRIVTEHIVRPDAWYLDAGKVPACIAIEAGQADLFLSAYLGADFVTNGRAVYRLLDATVTFHRGLPVAGAVIRYDIRITRFFRQGSTILFRFHFDATIEGELLLSMRDGCAGFFSAEELAAGQGIVSHTRDSGEQMEPQAEPLADLVATGPTQLDMQQVDALRRGDLAIAFGAPFEPLSDIKLNQLPASRMALVHRVPFLDPKGGRSRLGLIRAEADIQPNDWFLACHFVDDRVMPGTLMYEGCLHALRILLMRIGWVGPRGQVSFEPAVGTANRLRCRGQVVESTRVVTYEVSIKKLTYDPQPIAVADALIFADGKPIVEVRDMAVQLTGTDRRGLEKLWGIRPEPGTATKDANSASNDDTQGVRRPRVLFDRERIVEFAVGKASAAFGDRYRPFDEGRFLARLPAPPFQFIDRITRIDAQPWMMAAGSAATAEYDIAPEAWYFAADRQDTVPHAILLEVALQACGWLAAYMGSALHSDDDLKFRIIGGTGSKHRSVTRRTGRLSTRVKATKISKTAGMILQQYEYAVHDADGVVCDGSVDLGFFHPRMLTQPKLLREFAPLPEGLEDACVGRSFGFPTEIPFPDSRWRLVDEIHELAHEGGPRGLGFVRGSARIDPNSWLFKAHFRGDPVWPGSLGQESLLQLLKVAAAARFGVSPSSQFASTGDAIAYGFSYRGQITPTNRVMTIHAEIKQCDHTRRWLLADGCLDVDGRMIYQMRDFSLRLYEP
jgi:PfaB family protein